MKALAYTLSPQLSSAQNTIFTVQFGPQVRYFFLTRLAAAAAAEQAPTRNVSELLRTESGPDQLAPTNCFHCLKVPAIYPLSSRHLELDTLDTALLRDELLQFGLITRVPQSRYRFTTIHSRSVCRVFCTFCSHMLQYQFYVLT